MAHPPQSLMIFREELRKAKLEKERLRKSYEVKIHELSSSLDILKDHIDAQEEMIRKSVEYVVGMEKRLSNFKELLEIDEERNCSGYH